MNPVTASATFHVGQFLEDIVGVATTRGDMSATFPTKVVDKSFLPGGDNFIRNFVTTYLANVNVRNSLLVGLMQAYISKLNGHNNPVYGTAVTNFYLSLAGTESKQALEHVSTNLQKAVSIGHLQRF